ncbi:MAG: radical SAM protein with 4Fe4S-binding SPASM domain [Planctomycetota bacterium]|jgi:radical SAM protein with 4Fe4S-binding SPASM domain
MSNNTSIPVDAAEIPAGPHAPSKIFDYVEDHCRHGDINKYISSIIGPKFDEYRELWNRAHNLEVETEFPLHLSIESQLKCNYRCVMCTYSEKDELAKQQYPDVMSEELFDQIIDEAAEYNCPSINFNVLNEPLLDAETPRRIKKAHDAGFLDLRMNTNGSLLTADKAEAIIDAGLTRLYVGFDAASAETYEKVRVGGNYDKVVKNVLKFLEIRDKKGMKLPILRVSFVRMNINEHEIQDFMDFWQDKADMVTIQEYMPPVIREDFLSKHASSKRIPEEYTCPQPFERVVLKGNGDLTPCCAQYNYKLKMGNIHEQTIHELWHSPKMKELRGHMCDRTWDKLETCRTCLKSSYLYGS